ncbi:response regulator [Pedobacter sp. SD-b]|uniref:histidine kinase n=1 Tax=Pedobacter segetis TaxID=2793069 RepID=A0ABS1BL26_9SPHI|nr:two-component regulator propeller domain-containing protein [Pedobacter segetis]MBK0383593.1 response regulator [Pedobacter segetis]
MISFYKIANQLSFTAIPKFFKVRILACLILCLSSVVNEGFAQDYVINKFSHISTSNQFFLNSVTSIAQDKKGMMWFGTAKGLIRFDGIELKTIQSKFKNINPKETGNINDINIDSYGKIWIAADKGVWIYDPVLDSAEKFFENETNATPLTFVKCVKEMANGEVWLGTNIGIRIYDPKKKKLTEVSNKVLFSLNSINCLYQKKDGAIWIGTNSGLYKLIDKQNDRIKVQAFFNSTSNNKSIISNDINVLLEDKAGNLWVGTQAGLDYFDIKKNQFIHFNKNLTNNVIRALTIDKNQRLWVGTYDGITLIDSFRVTNHIKHDPDSPLSLVDNKIKFLYSDKYGSVWIGSYYGGINYWNEKQLNFSKIDEGNGHKLGFKVVSSILQDGAEKIYFGTEGEGISVLDAKTNKYQYVNKLNSNEKIGAIKTMCFSGKDNIWIGTFNSGLIFYNVKSKASIVYKSRPDDDHSLSSNKIISIAKISNGKILAGTLNSGLNILDTNTGRVIRLQHNDADGTSIPSNTIRDLLVDDNGDVYMGTPVNFYMVKKANQTANGKFIFDKLPLFNQQNKQKVSVQDILKASNGQIWVATLNMGLLYLKNGKLYNAAIDKDIAVFSVLEDHDGKLWLSTDKGILRYDPKKASSKIYNLNDGIAANAFARGSKLFSKDGRIYFGGASGVTSFNPKELGTINKYAPNIVITNFKLFDKDIEVGDSTAILKKSIADTKKIKLDYDQNIFTINFSMPNYIIHGKKVYQYRLKGLDDKWATTNNPSVSFTIQQGGTYIFEVKGINGDGYKTAGTTALEIVVNSAPWKTWWAYLFYMMIILGAFGLFIYFFQSKLILQHKLNLETIELDNQQKLNQQKLQFFTNVSHEFRTPLTLISGPLQKLIEDYKGPYQYYAPLITIKKNTDQLTKLINELLDFRKFEDHRLALKAAEGNIVEFLKEIFLSFLPQAKLNNYTYNFKAEEENILVYFDPDKLEKVFYNLISNAFKHTPEKGSICLEISKKENEVVVSVKDTGDGMKAEELEKIFDQFYEIQGQKHYGHFRYGSGIGLAIVKSVIDLHKGKIKVSSQGGKGSVFITYLPLGKNHLSESEIVTEFKENDLSLYSITEPLSSKIIKEFEWEEDIDKECVLVVEDNLEVGKFIQNILSDYYNVVLAENGVLGFQNAIIKQPSLIVSDMMMPEMDGLEFCQKIKNDIRTSHIPFILLSARTSLVYKFDGLKSGADDYLFKPFEVNELILKCKNILSTYHHLKERFLNSNITISDPSNNTLDETLRYKAYEVVNKNISNEFFGIDQFSEQLGLSRSLLFTKIKAWANQTPNEFILSIRMKHAAKMIEQGRYSIAEIGYKVGFKDPSYFSKIFKKHLNISPKIYSEKFKNC